MLTLILLAACSADPVYPPPAPSSVVMSPLVQPPKPAPASPVWGIVSWKQACPSCPAVAQYGWITPTEPTDQAKENPPNLPLHTHDGIVCRYCQNSCYMVRVAEAAAKAAGDDSDQNVQAKFTEMYGSGGGSSGGTLRGWLFRRR